jgi:hypothetical protein
VTPEWGGPDFQRIEAVVRSVLVSEGIAASQERNRAVTALMESLADSGWSGAHSGRNAV